MKNSPTIADLEAEVRARNAQWREHLANWAIDELRRQGMRMTPDGKIMPIPTKQEVPLAAASWPKDPAA
jgi:hypothetical protein